MSKSHLERLAPELRVEVLKALDLVGQHALCRASPIFLQQYLADRQTLRRCALKNSLGGAETISKAAACHFLDQMGIPKPREMGYLLNDPETEAIRADIVNIKRECTEQTHRHLSKSTISDEQIESMVRFHLEIVEPVIQEFCRFCDYEFRMAHAGRVLAADKDLCEIDDGNDEDENLSDLVNEDRQPMKEVIAWKDWPSNANADHEPLLSDHGLGFEERPLSASEKRFLTRVVYNFQYRSVLEKKSDIVRQPRPTIDATLNAGHRAPEVESVMAFEMFIRDTIQNTLLALPSTAESFDLLEAQLKKIDPDMYLRVLHMHYFPANKSCARTKRSAIRFVLKQFDYDPLRFHSRLMAATTPSKTPPGNHIDHSLFRKCWELDSCANYWCVLEFEMEFTLKAANYLPADPKLDPPGWDLLTSEGHLHSQTLNGDRKQCRRWGYCFWDRDRLVQSEAIKVMDSYKNAPEGLHEWRGTGWFSNWQAWACPEANKPWIAELGRLEKAARKKLEERRGGAQMAGSSFEH